jgi:predicted alpha/beta hydrolase family esterase
VAVPHILVLSSSDPWLPTAAGLRWAARWGGPVVTLGDAGHINIASGFGPLPLASHWVASTARPESTSTLLEATFQ